MLNPPHAPRRARTSARRTLLTLLPLLALASLGVLLSPGARTAPADAAATAEAVETPAAAPDPAEAYGMLPLQFEANRGQADGRVRYISRGDGYVLFLTPDEAVMALGVRGAHADAKASSREKREEGYRVLRMRLAGANAAPKVEGREEMSGRLNYFVGSGPAEWRTNVPVYASVHYAEVYPGIDLVYYGNQRQLEYDFRVAPGADPGLVKIRFEGAERAKVDEGDGSLVLNVGGGEVRMKRPVIYQTADDGSRREVEGGYRIKGSEVEFRVGTYDAGRPLVIDPILSYSTFLGATATVNFPNGAGLALDTAGAAYVTGATGFLAFPAPGVKLVTAGNFSNNVFVTKLNPAGTALVYTSYLGGSSDETGLGVAVDSSGAAYVTGRTSSTNFPTANALRSNDDLIKSADGGATWQVSNTGLGNAPVTRLWADPASASTLYALTFNGLHKTTDGGATWAALNTGLHNPGDTFVSAFAVTPTNPSILYAGNSGSSASVKKSTDGGATWAPANTGLPGLSVTALAVDPVNPSVVYAGAYFDLYRTTDGGANWGKVNVSNTVGSLQTIVIDPSNASVIYAHQPGGGVQKSTNGGVNWSPASNGISPPFTSGLVMDPTNPATLYAATSTGVYKTTNGAGNWSQVNTGLTNLSVRSLAFDPNAPATVYAGTTRGGIYKTTNGGANWSQVRAGMGFATVLSLAVGAASQVYAGLDTVPSGFSDSEAFAAKLSPAGDALVYSTFLGGSSDDSGDAVAVDSSGNAYVAGRTASGDFPLAGPRQSSLKGGADAFVAKLGAAGNSLLFSTLVGGGGLEHGRSLALDTAGNAYVCGETTSSDFPSTPGAFSATFSGAAPFPGGNDGFVFKLDAAGSALSYSTYLGGNGDDRASAVAVDAGGNAYVAGSTTSSNFPTANAFQSALNAGGAAYVTKLNAAGSALVYSTYVNGGNAAGIAIDAAGAAYVTGSTGSDNSFPVTPGTLKNKSLLYASPNGGNGFTNDNYGLDAGLAVRDLVADPFTPHVLYAATDKGVYKSTNGGRNWSGASAGLAAPRVTHLAIDPKTPTTLYAIVTPNTFDTPKIFKTTDGGASWGPLNSTSNFFFAGPIAVDPVTTSNVYVNDGNRVLKSTDGGASWNPAAPTSPGGVTSLAIDPSNPSTVYAGTNSTTGVYKTTDGGANWAPAGAPLQGPVNRIVIDPAHTSTLYAQAGGGVYKSTDGGANWLHQLDSATPSSLLAIDPAEPSTLYAYATKVVGLTTVSGAFYRTTDGGATWRRLNGSTPYTPTVILVDPHARANLYIGTTLSNETDGDAFLFKLAPAGNALVYSTVFGGAVGDSPSYTGARSDSGIAVAVDAQGAAYVAGLSHTPDFPTTQGSFLPYNRSGRDYFVARFVTAPGISGVVTDGSNVPVQGVKITLTGSATDTRVTGADGAFVFPNLPSGGTYTLSATKAGATFTPPTHTITNLVADQTANFTRGAGAATHRIAGRLTEADGTPVSGARVALSGSHAELTVTDASGNYSFNAPAGGSYTVTPAAVGFAFAPPSVGVNNLSSEQTLNFTAARQDLVVTNTNDAGAGSLRQALLDANAVPGRDRISFNIPGAGVHVISVNTQLPAMTEPFNIDGTTQPGYAGLPLVELNGANVFTPADVSGITITAGDSTVRGLAINGFNGSGILLTLGGNNRVEGNVIGLDAAGAVARGNKGNGVSVVNNSTGNVIGGTSPSQRNVISGNGANGVSLSSGGNFVRGNYIGTDASGSVKLGNGQVSYGNGWGVTTTNIQGQSTAGNRIGGTEPGARNVISGNLAGGVEVTAPDTVVQGNYIGTDASGTVKVGNFVGVKISALGAVVGGTTAAARNVISGNTTGVSIQTFSTVSPPAVKGNYIGTDASGAAKLGNGTGITSSGAAEIGGTEAGAGNLISGNEHAGIQLDCCTVGLATVKGNLIGTDAAGAQPLGNFTGVDVQATQQVVGGTEPGARNVISGNMVGVNVGGRVFPGPSGVRIQGNYIGVNAAGDGSVPNVLRGIVIYTSGVTVGGDGAGEGNTIAFNGDGILASGNTADNTFRGNSIFSNSRLGIDLTDAFSLPGFTANDAGDADEGTNHLQNFPAVSSFANVAGGTNVKGTLNSTPNTQFRIDFYANAACDPAGGGEGARPFGNTLLATDASGNAAFDVTLAGQLPAGRVVTATATDPTGNTSEFSPCDAGSAQGSVHFSYPAYNALEDVGAATVRVVRTGGSRGTLTVSYATGGGTATAGADYTPASGQLTFAEGETEKSITIPVADDGVAEAVPESVVITLSGTPDLESLGANARATLNIFDATTSLSFSVDDIDVQGLSFNEGDAGRRNAVVTVRLLAATSRAVTVEYSTASGTAATPGVDFVPVSGTLTFAPGSETREVVLPILGDTTDEFNEFFTFQLRNASAGATLTTPNVNINIIDDDAPPTLSVSDVAVVEGAGAKALFAVRLSQPSGKFITVGYGTSDGTATAPDDYTPTSAGTVLVPGQTLRVIEVPVSADAAAEGDETFFLNVSVSDQTRATVADGQGLATIKDASSPASLVQFGAPSFAVGEADGQALVIVTRTGDTSQPAAVDYRTVGQTASERSDFTASLGTLRFAAGETQKTFAVLITDDRFQESPESLHLVLSNAAGASLGGPNVVALNISSNDASDGRSPVAEPDFDTTFFVRQHYHDFLNREPDAAGLAFWVGEIEQCGTDAVCREVKKIHVSAAFFLSIEFQETGYLVYRTYKAAYGDATSPNVAGTVPVIRLNEFLPDTQRIGRNVVVGAPDWEQTLEANKQAYMAEFVSRQRFIDAFPLTMTSAQFVDKLNQNAGGVLSQSERDQLVAELAGAPDQTQGRANALRRVSEDADMRAGERNRAFVLMQYYGYLRRNPDDPQDTDFRGWKFWLDKLNEFNGNFVQAEMVKAFLDSVEYRNRFGL